jgi:hypothetical protein
VWLPRNSHLLGLDCFGQLSFQHIYWTSIVFGAKMFETFYKSYLEAISFTDPEHTLTDYDKCQAWTDCRNFYSAISVEIKWEIPLKQAGHDFWLTRNGHGTGFWDRPEIYGEDRSRILTALSITAGEVYLDQCVIFDQ